MKQLFIELHDTYVETIAHEADTVLVRFSEAVLYTRPGNKYPEGSRIWMVPAEMRISAGSIEGKLPSFGDEDADECYLSGGTLQCGDEVHKGTIPVPLELGGETELRLQFAWFGSVTVRGTGICLQLLGEPKFLEEFDAGN